MGIGFFPRTSSRICCFFCFLELVPLFSTHQAKNMCLFCRGPIFFRPRVISTERGTDKLQVGYCRTIYQRTHLAEHPGILVSVTQTFGKAVRFVCFGAGNRPFKVNPRTCPCSSMIRLLRVQGLFCLSQLKNICFFGGGFLTSSESQKRRCLLVVCVWP